MKLSSTLLSATAILAHAASGFRLRAQTRLPDFPWSPIATLRGDTVGFYDGATDWSVDIDLQGPNIGNGFGLQPQADPRLFIFKSDRLGAQVRFSRPPWYILALEVPCIRHFTNVSGARSFRTRSF
jgi:hypothetical protein